MVRRRIILSLVLVVLAAFMVIVGVTSERDSQSPAEALRYWGETLGLLHVNENDAYAFEVTYGPDHQPARWPACATLDYVVNTTHAPGNALATLRHEFAYLHQVTGYSFHFDGRTSATDYSSYDADRATQPILISWATPTNTRLLGHTNVDGVTRIFPSYDDTTYRSAVVLFNDQYNTNYATNSNFAEHLTLHELAHVIGLADVQDSQQIMNEYVTNSATQTTFGAGDLHGLARLSYAGCPR